MLINTQGINYLSYIFFIKDIVKLNYCITLTFNDLFEIIMVFSQAGYEVVTYPTQGPEDAERKVRVDGADYDLIVTGDLGSLGSQLARELCLKKGVDLENRYFDCGERIFTAAQNVKAGGSGCGCSAVVLNAYLLKELFSGVYRRVLFLATGALLSPESSQQGESIPGVAHAVALECC